MRARSYLVIRTGAVSTCCVGNKCRLVATAMTCEQAVSGALACVY